MQASQTKSFDVPIIETQLNARLKLIQLKIYDAAISFKITSYTDFELKEKIKPEEIKSKVCYEKYIQDYPDPNDPYYAIDSIIPVTFHPQTDIKGIQCIFISNFEYPSSSVRNTLSAMALLYQSIDFLPPMPFLIFKYEDLKSILNDDELEFISNVSVSLIGNNIE